MATVSVKISDNTKAKLQRQAKSQGLTSHALMVSAIESVVSQSEQQQSFVQQAVKARQKLIQTGQALDGDALSQYLKAKARGKSMPKPSPVHLHLLKPEAA
jgi:predicted transcriptional regulator